MRVRVCVGGSEDAKDGDEDEEEEEKEAVISGACCSMRRLYYSASIVNSQAGEWPLFFPSNHPPFIRASTKCVVRGNVAVRWERAESEQEVEEREIKGRC